MNFNTDCKRHASISRDMCLEFALRFPTDIIENIFEHRRNISRTPLARHPWACGRGSYERSTTFVLFIFLLFPPPRFSKGGGERMCRRWREKAGCVQNAWYYRLAGADVKRSRKFNPSRCYDTRPKTGIGGRQRRNRSWRSGGTGKKFVPRQIQYNCKIIITVYGRTPIRPLLVSTKYS